jgi:hypothetical protein
MPAAKAKAAPGSALPALPMVSLARVEEGTRLVERLFKEKADLFIAAGDEYREMHRAGSSRTLSHQEAAQVAAAMSQTPTVGLIEEVQASSLRAYEDPTPQEVLLAAGLATAPAFLDAAKKLTALIELPQEEFDTACETDTLDEVVAAAAAKLGKIAAVDARARATRALEHFAKGAGTSPGEAWGLLTRMVGQAYSQSLQIIGASMTPGSPSLTGSPPSTDGPAETSST